MNPTTTVLGLDPNFVPYQEAWDLQKKTHEAVANHSQSPEIFLLEHDAVYTAGKRTEEQDRPTDGTPVIDVDRGGLLTWHGPGQLVGYPIIELADKAGIRPYVETLEQALINVIADYGVKGERVKGRSGVWIVGDGITPDRKIAAIGIRVDHGVTMHGFALNCSHSIDPYNIIVPCGITDAGVTTISLEAGKTVTPSDVVDRVAEELVKLLTPLMKNQSAIETDVPQTEGINA
ncbi:lipoyl(octanoyl) transferase LipB [Neomicrococcus lactis]|uniref:Octanoyltransferase n=1 Tax=Neomicrococcus lactis TaxID=732241 RepID=A0A7W8Y995_9MICC|nr:lipoyl(octanoyl) transferase LipB [Neomicrococcus lactis]MBB5597296.1 lipoyl(octanoyl) transferase [Neomicrococcus lactis]